MSEKNSKKKDKKEVSIFEKETNKLFPEFKKILLDKEKHFKKVKDIAIKLSNGKCLGFYILPSYEMKNNVPTPNFNDVTLTFIFDDLENPLFNFSSEIFFKNHFNELFERVKTKDPNVFDIVLKDDKSIKFKSTTIANIRENCFDSIYSDLVELSKSIIYEDDRNFLMALKSIEIHKGATLQKFEKYVVAYVGAGSWLRGEKSNDFDVFIIIDDTDVKQMPRLQVKDQLTKIIWQLSYDVANLTGVQIHIQVYLLTDFWDALKDAHPVIFTFLRDGVPFYDRGIYTSWKELLKLGKVKPSQEAIDMHMNAGSQLVDFAKKTFSSLITNNIYWAVLNPSQAILMLKGYNPTTPKETIKMFEEVLLKKEKIISQKELDILKTIVKTYKGIEHNKELIIKGQDIDKFLEDTEYYLKKIKKLFEDITDEKVKESFSKLFEEFEDALKNLFESEKKKEINFLVKKLNLDYIKTSKIPSFVESSIKNILKTKKDFDTKKVTITEINKCIKELKVIIKEIKNLKEDMKLTFFQNQKRMFFRCEKNRSYELFKFDKVIYIYNFEENKIFENKENKFVETKKILDNFSHIDKFESIELNENLINLIKKSFKIEKIKL